jgi:lipopolysaccharide transport system permease protein
MSYGLRAPIRSGNGAGLTRARSPIQVLAATLTETTRSEQQTAAPAAVPDAPWREFGPEGTAPWAGFAELWRSRELLFHLAARDVKARYKQTVLGAAWAVLQPLLLMAIFSVVFGRLAGLGRTTDGVPYPLYVFAGLLPWTFFSTAVSSSSASLVTNANLVKKVYFPRLALPLASLGAPLVDLAIALGVLALIGLTYGGRPSASLLLAPLFLLGTVLAAAGVGCLLGALTVTYRDFRHVVPFLLQFWLFATPVIYPVRLAPESWRPFFALNPMAGMVDGFRAAVLDRPPDVLNTLISAGVALTLLLAGTWVFHRVERGFADVI